MKRYANSTPMIPLDAGLFINAFNKPSNFGKYLFCVFSWRKKGPNIQANRVVPKSNPIVKLIVLVGRRAIAIGIPRNEVLLLMIDRSQILKICLLEK